MNSDRLLPVSGREMVKVFSRIGFSVIRQKGSHIVMARDEEILVIPDHDVVAKGTERDLIRDAGISVSEFNRLLKDNQLWVWEFGSCVAISIRKSGWGNHRIRARITVPDQAPCTP